MARVTVEDCLEHVDNRFQLVVTASKRARKLADSGVDPEVDWDNDKPTVVALREIAGGYLDRNGEVKPLAVEDLVLDDESEEVAGEEDHQA